MADHWTARLMPSGRRQARQEGSRAGFALALVATLLAGCSGSGSDLGSAATPPPSISAASNASAFPDSTTGAAPNNAPIMAFGEIPDGTSSGREVIENPSAADIALTGSLPEMSLGRPDAPVTMVMYASLTCPHCRAFHSETFPELKRTYIDTGRLRFIMREFPIGRQSGTATIALRCAPPEKYFTLYAKFMEQQASWVSQEVRPDPIFAVAKQVGMTRDQFDSCLKNQAMIDGLKWVKDRGRKLGIIGTPNFFVAGKLEKKTLTMSDIRALVDQGAASRAASANAE